MIYTRLINLKHYNFHEFCDFLTTYYHGSNSLIHKYYFYVLSADSMEVIKGPIPFVLNTDNFNVVSENLFKELKEMNNSDDIKLCITPNGVEEEELQSFFSYVEENV